MFRTFGYAKTTVSDVARDAGISTAYVYRFFPSKLAICEAVCGTLLSRFSDLVWREATSTLPAPEKLERIYVELTQKALRLLFEEQRLLDIVRVGLNEQWASVEQFQITLVDVARHVLLEGVERGEFRQVDDAERTAGAVAATLLLCAHPVLLQQAVQKDPVGRARSVASLVLSGLSAKRD